MANARDILKDNRIIRCAFDQAFSCNYNYMYLLDENKAKNKTELALYKLINNLIRDYVTKRKKGIEVYSRSLIDIKINQFRLKHWYFKKIDFEYEYKYSKNFNYCGYYSSNGFVRVEVK